MPNAFDALIGELSDMVITEIDRSLKAKGHNGVDRARLSLLPVSPTEFLTSFVTTAADVWPQEILEECAGLDEAPPLAA